MNNAKENWLIASREMRKSKNKDFCIKRFPKKIRKKYENAIQYAASCYEERGCADDRYGNFDITTKGKLLEHLIKKGFKKEWTGYKWTWVKKEPNDVPF